MLGAGVAMRALQEWMGHRDFKTTRIYAGNAPDAGETELVERAFGGGHVGGHEVRTPQSTSATPNVA
jgi:hypothetical protein